MPRSRSAGRSWHSKPGQSEGARRTWRTTCANRRSWRRRASSTKPSCAPRRTSRRRTVGLAYVLRYLGEEAAAWDHWDKGAADTSVPAVLPGARSRNLVRDPHPGIAVRGECADGAPARQKDCSTSCASFPIFTIPRSSASAASMCLQHRWRCRSLRHLAGRRAAHSRFGDGAGPEPVPRASARPAAPTMPACWARWRAS